MVQATRAAPMLERQYIERLFRAARPRVSDDSHRYVIQCDAALQKAATESFDKLVSPQYNDGVNNGVCHNDY
jgi:hypothetical protein